MDSAVIRSNSKNVKMDTISGRATCKDDNWATVMSTTPLALAYGDYIFHFESSIRALPDDGAICIGLAEESFLDTVGVLPGSQEGVDSVGLSDDGTARFRGKQFWAEHSSRLCYGKSYNVGFSVVGKPGEVCGVRLFWNKFFIDKVYWNIGDMKAPRWFPVVCLKGKGTSVLLGNNDLQHTAVIPFVAAPYFSQLASPASKGQAEAAELAAKKEKERKAAEARKAAAAKNAAEAKKRKADNAKKKAAEAAKRKAESARAAAELKSSLASLPAIEFEINSSDLRSQSNAAMDRVVVVLGKFPNIALKVEGQSRGTKKANTTLAMSRSRAVMQYFVKKGIDTTRLHTAAKIGNEASISVEFYPM